MYDGAKFTRSPVDTNMVKTKFWMGLALKSTVLGVDDDPVIVNIQTDPTSELTERR